MKHKQQIYWLFIAFLATRLIFVFVFPPFVDESNYVFLGQLALGPSNNLFAPLTLYGKQPLPMWIYGYAGTFFSNPVLGGRLFILILSIPSFFILYQLVKAIENKKIAIFSLVLYSLCPIFIFSQATAMIDNFLLLLAIPILFLLYKLDKKFSLVNLAIFGLLFALILQMKSNGLFLAAISYLALLYIIYKQSRSYVKKFFYLAYPVTLTLIFLIPFIVKGYVEYFFLGVQKFALTGNEATTSPILIWFNNFFYLFLSLFIYLSPIVFLIFLFFGKKIIKTKFRLFLLAWFLLPVLATCLTSNGMRTRYILYSLSGLIPLIALSLDIFIKKMKKSRQQLVKICLFGSVFAFSLILMLPTYFFSLFPKGSIIEGERDYAFGWPSGYGIIEALDYFDQVRPANTDIILIVPDVFNSYPSSFAISKYSHDSNIRIASLPLDQTATASAQMIAKQMPTFVFTSSTFLKDDFKPIIQPIKEFPKPGNEDFLGLYQVKPQ